MFQKEVETNLGADFFRRQNSQQVRTASAMLYNRITLQHTLFTRCGVAVRRDDKATQGLTAQNMRLLPLPLVKADLDMALHRIISYRPMSCHIAPCILYLYFCEYLMQNLLLC